MSKLAPALTNAVNHGYRISSFGPNWFQLHGRFTAIADDRNGTAKQDTENLQNVIGDDYRIEVRWKHLDWTTYELFVY